MHCSLKLEFQIYLFQHIFGINIEFFFSWFHMLHCYVKIVGHLFDIFSRYNFP